MEAGNLWQEPSPNTHSPVMDHSARTFNLLCRELLQGLRAGGCGLQMGVLPPSGKRRPWGGRAKPRGTRAHPRPRFSTDFTLFGLKTKTAKKDAARRRPREHRRLRAGGGLTNGCLSRRVLGYGGSWGAKRGPPRSPGWRRGGAAGCSQPPPGDRAAAEPFYKTG